jgi:hypothetical protein
MIELEPTHSLHKTIQCPICKSKKFDYVSYSEYGWGTVEQHGFCDRCGYIVEQAYSPVYEAFWDVKRGFKHPNGHYISKNVKKHRRIRRKKNIRNIEVNPVWINYI